MKKVKFFFIEYVPASNSIDDFDEVARFAPDWNNRLGYWFKYLDSGKILKTRDDAGKIPHRL